jgi:hypothetical protein
MEVLTISVALTKRLNSQSLYWEVMLFGSAGIRKRTSLASCGAARAPA